MTKLAEINTDTMHSSLINNFNRENNIPTKEEETPTNVIPHSITTAQRKHLKVKLKLYYKDLTKQRK